MISPFSPKKWRKRHQAVAPQLRPYQLAGFRWMACLCKNGLGAVLADDMGLGKTLQCISVLLYLKDGGWGMLEQVGAHEHH